MTTSSEIFKEASDTAGAQKVDAAHLKNSRADAQLTPKTD
jgi:hypothetical protein